MGSVCMMFGLVMAGSPSAARAWASHAGSGSRIEAAVTDLFRRSVRVESVFFPSAPLIYSAVQLLDDSSRGRLEESLKRAGRAKTARRDDVFEAEFYEDEGYLLPVVVEFRGQIPEIDEARSRMSSALWWLQEPELECLEIMAIDVFDQVARAGIPAVRRRRVVFNMEARH